MPVAAKRLRKLELVFLLLRGWKLVLGIHQSGRENRIPLRRAAGLQLGVAAIEPGPREFRAPAVVKPRRESR